MDITVELPANPQRLVTGMLLVYRRSRLASQTAGVVLTAWGIALLAWVLMDEGDGYTLVLGALTVVLGVALFRRYDRAINISVARRPAYAHDACTVRLTDDGMSVTYPQASLQVAWPAITKVTSAEGHWLFRSGWTVVLVLPVGSLGADERRQLEGFLAQLHIGAAGTMAG